MFFTKQDKSGKKTLRNWVLLVILVAFFTSLFTIDYFIKADHDANTHIVNAQVISTEKSKGARRSLPNYYVIVQEQGKSETTRVSVDLGTWVTCDPGMLLKDIPNERPKCYDLGRISKRSLSDLADIKPYEFKEIDLSEIP